MNSLALSRLEAQVFPHGVTSIVHQNDLENLMTNLNPISAKDVLSKWTQLTDVEASSIKSFESLSAQVAKSYKLDRTKADAEVKSWMVGRTF